MPTTKVPAFNVVLARHCKGLRVPGRHALHDSPVMGQGGCRRSRVVKPMPEGEDAAGSAAGLKPMILPRMKEPGTSGFRQMT